MRWQRGAHLPSHSPGLKIRHPADDESYRRELKKSYYVQEYNIYDKNLKKIMFKLVSEGHYNDKNKHDNIAQNITTTDNSLGFLHPFV